MEGPASSSSRASSVEAAELPAGEAYQMAATVVAETANEYSKKRPKMTLSTAVFAIDPFVVLHGAGERRISQHHLNSAGVAK